MLHTPDTIRARLAGAGAARVFQNDENDVRV